LFSIVARRSISSEDIIDLFEFEGWWLVLRKKGTSVYRTTLMRPEVEPFAMNLAKSTSSVRKVDHSGSREVGCGIVIPVSTVAWDESSEGVVVAVVSSDEAVWEEFRGVEVGILLREALFLAELLAGLVPVAVAVAEGTALGGVVVVRLFLLSLLLLSVVVAALEADGAVLSESVERELLRDEAESDSEEALLEKTLWGRCLILVRYKLARFSARLVLLCDSVDWGESPSRSARV